MNPLPSHNINIQKLAYITLSLLNFKGRKGEETAKTLISASIWQDSIENKSKEYKTSPQTIRNYIEEQGIQLVDKMLQEIQKIALEQLKGVEEVNISIDWTGIKYWGKKVEGLGSGEKGYQWNYATATTKHNDKTIILAFTQYTSGMSKDEIVKMLVEQVLSLGFKIGIIALDAGFYSIEVIRFLSQFKYIISVPVGDVKIYDEYDGTYTTRSKREKDQVSFRLIVHAREVTRKGKCRVEYVARGTNLDLPKHEVLRLYDEVRNPIETSYREIKSFLVFTCSRSWVFRLFVFVLAMFLYSLFLFFKGVVKRVDFKLFLALIFVNEIENEFISRFIKVMEPLFINFNLFLRR
ncbi:ISH3 family transposase [Sulfolobus tengchongensis]|uniref:ISH3 family transposase n=1 Tax=Sulfolobus tengchongensis TaxID=207809 RepID=A0AAX4KYA9_9CREN